MTDPLDAFRRQGEIDAAKPLPVPINWKARAEKAEAEVERLEAQIADLRAYNERLTGLVDKWHRDAEFNGTACDEQKKRAEVAENALRAVLEAKP